MNWIDIVFLVTIAGFTITGFALGVIRQFTSLAGVIIGIVLATQFWDEVAGYLAFLGSSYAGIAAFAGIIILVTIAAIFVGRAFSKTASLLFLGALDHLVGAVFGFVQGGMVVLALTLLLIEFPLFNIARAVVESAIGSSVLGQASLWLGLLPEGFENVRNLVS